MRAGQAQGRNCPQMRRGSREGLIWEEEGGAWRAEARRDGLGGRRAGKMEGAGPVGQPLLRRLLLPGAPGDPLPGACEAGSTRGTQAFSACGSGPHVFRLQWLGPTSLTGLARPRLHQQNIGPPREAKDGKRHYCSLQDFQNDPSTHQKKASSMFCLVVFWEPGSPVSVGGTRGFRTWDRVTGPPNPAL